MPIRSILLLALAMMVLAGACAPSGPASAQSANLESQREGVVAACEDDGGNADICACGFDKWAGGLTDPASPSAQAFVDMMLLPDDQRPDPETLSAAMTHMRSFSQSLLDCANISLENEEMVLETGESETGTAGADAAVTEDADPAADAKAEPVLMNGVDLSTQDKRYAWRDRTFEELEETGLRDTPVAQFEDAHKAYCMADRNDVSACRCSWDALVTSLEGRDDVPARIAAYMSSVPPSDIADVSASERQAGGELFSNYLAVRDCG